MKAIKLEQNITYKIQTKNANQMYTGIIVEQDETHIKIRTIKNEIVLILREDIVKAKGIENGY